MTKVNWSSTEGVMRNLQQWLFILLAIGFLTVVETDVRSDEPDVKTVLLTVDYGDGVQKKFTSIEWKDKMTILDILKVATKHRRGIRFKYQASGSIALLTSIDDLKNEGGQGKNWIYWVNQKLGERSFAIRSLSAGDHVLWKFGTYE